MFVNIACLLVVTNFPFVVLLSFFLVHSSAGEKGI